MKKNISYQLIIGLFLLAMSISCSSEQHGLETNEEPKLYEVQFGISPQFTVETEDMTNSDKPQTRYSYIVYPCNNFEGYIYNEDGSLLQKIKGGISNETGRGVMRYTLPAGKYYVVVLTGQRTANQDGSTSEVGTSYNKDFIAQDYFTDIYERNYKRQIPSLDHGAIEVEVYEGSQNTYEIKLERLWSELGVIIKNRETAYFPEGTEYITLGINKYSKGFYMKDGSIATTEGSYVETSIYVTESELRYNGYFPYMHLLHSDGEKRDIDLIYIANDGRTVLGKTRLGSIAIDKGAMIDFIGNLPESAEDKTGSFTFSVDTSWKGEEEVPF